MIQRVNVNLDAVEAMLYFWQSTKDRQRVSELFIFDVTDMPGLKYAYDNEFNSESVRRALSAIQNREIFSGINKQEGRFYNNNLWMLEDLDYTDRLARPIKKLNLQFLVEKLNTSQGSENFEELEIIFSPLHLNEYMVKNNKLIINFFMIRPSDIDETVFLGEKELMAFIEEKLKEIICSKLVQQKLNIESSVGDSTGLYRTLPPPKWNRGS